PYQINSAKGNFLDWRRGVNLKRFIQTVIDESINDIYEMPVGVGATRKSHSDVWEPFKIS
ncbi:hypothetical protein, partial [Pedobacter fastidiosus]|uniref:hypothetical protein n=1 Tax=Pedobacter fastidiosus TaxID=2765361 RepID=UPI001C9A6ABA